MSSGAKVGESGPAARGIEIHQILATYINHLVRTTRTRNLEVFDGLTKGAGTEAREVLEKFRDNHAFDPAEDLATELHIALDENFVPIEHPGDDGPIAAYEGTLDLVMLHSLTEAEIEDWKKLLPDHRRGHLPSKFYPLLLMCLNPSLERVKFALEFVRYGVSRCVEYTREDMPWLKDWLRGNGHVNESSMSWLSLPPQPFRRTRPKAGLHWETFKSLVRQRTNSWKLSLTCPFPLSQFLEPRHIFRVSYSTQRDKLHIVTNSRANFTRSSEGLRHISKSG